MRIFTALVWTTAVYAHLIPHHDAVGELLRDAPIVALVEITGAAHPTTEGSETPAKRVTDIVGHTAKALVLVQRGGHLHALQPGDVVLAPIERSPAGRLIYLASRSRRPLHVAQGERRAAIGFVTSWRQPKTTESERIDRWIALTRHPASIARRIGFEALSRNVDTVRPAMTTPRVDALAAALDEPEVPLERKLAIISVLGMVGSTTGAEFLAARLLTLSPVKVRHAAATIVGRFPTPNGRRALLQCAKHAGGGLAERCTRILARRGAR